jgi:serine/threonine-protein kinase
MHAGQRIGHYEILSAIGRGGMGEVWKARDVKLKRDVALKALPAELAQSADRRARLEREATALAALNHSNIAAIYGVEDHSGTHVLVLELVEGGTLAERLLRGPVRVEEALKITLQIAAALEAAHEKGVIHRDLKPANVKITPQGTVKVLDFGLAKKIAQVPADMHAPTALQTEIGVVMGTAAYMSPELARGEEVGRQSDIWALGVMLYEMLTGELPFKGATSADTLAGVLERQPNYSILPKHLPDGARRVLRRCLDKDRARRFQHAGDARIEIEDALAAPAPEATRAPSGRLGYLTAALALAVAVLGGVAIWSFAGRGGSVTRPEPVRLSLSFAGAPQYVPYGARHLAISRDGSRVAYAAMDRLWIRRLSEPESIAVDRILVLNPFFSPDGEWVGFFSLDGVLKVPARGGTPILIAGTTERSAGASWGTDGTIVFAMTDGLYQVAENGGEVRLLARPNLESKEQLYAWPELLPDGRTVLFTRYVENSPPEVRALDLTTLGSRVVLTGGSAARYAAPERLIYASVQGLHAVPFALDELESRGEAVTLRGLDIAMNIGATEFAFSDTGTLVFLGPREPNAVALQSLMWIDRQGAEEPLPFEPGPYGYPRVSPDGTLVAMDMRSGDNRDVWIWDLRRSSLTKLTSGATEDMMPLWSNDGRRVYFSSNRAGTFDVYSQPADGATDARVEVSAPGFQTPLSLTPDGRELVVYENFHDVSVLDIARSDLRPLLHSDVEHRLAEISPDGNWIAFESAESGGQFEVFVRPFPDVSARREKVSVNGGRYPRWGLPDSGELYYVDLDGAMMAVSMELAPALRVGTATKLFEIDKPPPGVTGRPYDISPLDGRFITTKVTPRGNDVAVSVVLDWFAEIDASVPRR